MEVIGRVEPGAETESDAGGQSRGCFRKGFKDKAIIKKLIGCAFKVRCALGK